ncbi:Rrf2 family transcriptional regulator [Alicyclobacillaceae bacterium I2511]|nr:Rrf2 family transcriptional regulator [Alicyclobacillaceae bacterium I2511]
MKISTRGRYGLMLLVDLAQHDVGNPISLKSVAERQGLSEHYLEQLIAPLRNAGLVRSIRGAYGGYVLAKSPAEMTAKQVLSLLEGPVTIVDEDMEDGFEPLWSRLRNVIQEVLSAVTIQDLSDMSLHKDGSYMYYI